MSTTAVTKKSNATASSTSATNKANSSNTNDTKANSNANNNNDNGKQQRLTYIANVVRALVTSRKPPCKLREVLREYPEIEGEPLNFRKYGYASAKDLLKATNEFTFMQYGDETYINAIHSQKSAHISSMVRQQKSSKSTRITPVPQARQPKRTDQSWNKSSYSSNVYQRLPATGNQQQQQQQQRGRNAFGAAGDRNNNNNQQQNNNNRNNQQQQQQKPQLQQSKSSQQQQQQQKSTQQQKEQKSQQQAQQQQPKQTQVQQSKQSQQQSSKQAEQPQKQQQQQKQQSQQQQNKTQQSSPQKEKQQQQQQQQQHKSQEGQRQQQALQRQKSVGASGGKDLRDMLNTKMPQPQQQTAATQSQNAAKSNQIDKTNTGVDLRERLNFKKQQTNQQSQEQQQPSPASQTTEQSQQKSSPRPILGQNNNSAIAIASTLILAQREQKMQEQHQQQRAQLLAAQHMRQQQQQQQLKQQQLLQLQQTQQILLDQSLKQQQLQQQQQARSIVGAKLASAPQLAMPGNPSALGNNSIQLAMPGNASALGNNSVQNRLRIRVSNGNGNGTATNGFSHTNGSNTPDSSPAISSAGSENFAANPFVGAMLQQQQQLPQPQFHKRYVSNTQYQDANGGQQVIPPRIFQFNPKLDPITSLAQYCVVRRYPPPGYSTIYSKFSRLYQCRVNVNGTIFSTYPNEYPNEHIAKISCAQKAIDQLKLQESRRPLPLCADSDAELVEKLYAELLQHPHGIFAKNIPETFSEAYQQSLPEHWWTLVQTSHKFTTESATNNAVIVFANLDADKDKAPGTPGVTIQMDGIALPWKQKYWQLYITYCGSTVDVWARLFGKEYSERFDAVMNEIDGYMKMQKTRPLSLACKNIYLVCMNECWHRVRVDELDKPNATARCFFIDYGDNDWVAVSELYICEAQFLRLPAQAVLFSLFGLEDFAGNPNARRHLDTMLSSKSVVGEILTKETDFYNTESSACGKIQVVLYDTSTEEDVNLNPLLLSKICDDTPPPEIKHKGATNVLVSHVSDEGDLYLQILNTDFKYVQKLIQQLIESKFKRDQHKITHTDLKRSNLFLICDDTVGSEPQWYRGALTEAPFRAEDEEFDIFYVDQGITRRTHISKMFRLESLSAALSKFPRQAIKARLHNIPPINKSIVGRMRALLPANCAAFVKMNNPGKVPYVTIYRRHESSDMLCNINEDIRMEAELESTSTSMNRDDDDALGNGSLSKNSSGSSLPSPSSTKSFMDMTRGLTITSVPNSPQRAAELPKLKNYDAIPSNPNEFFEVRVTMSANPSNFTIQPYKDYPRLRDIMKELQEYCENNDEFIPADMVEIGQAYAAKNPDGFYHRITVVNTYNGEMIHVCFCDFGDIAILRSDQLKILPAKYRQLPKMAIQAKLYGITAKNGDWSLEDCLRFRQLTVAQKFMATIKRITYDKLSTPSTQILELELIDVKTDDDVYIHEILLEEQRAVKEDGSN